MGWLRDEPNAAGASATPSSGSITMVFYTNPYSFIRLQRVLRLMPRALAVSPRRQPWASRTARSR